MTESYEHLSTLNPSQRAAAEYGTVALPLQLPGPLLIIAGAGTGKTTTLAHRVAHLMVRGADPARRADRGQNPEERGLGTWAGRVVGHLPRHRQSAPAYAREDRGARPCLH